MGIRSLSDPGLPVRKTIWDNNFGQSVFMPDAIDNSTHVPLPVKVSRFLALNLPSVDTETYSPEQVVEEPTCSSTVTVDCTNQPTPVDFYGATISLLANVTPPSYFGFIQRLWHWQGPPPPKAVDGTMLWPGETALLSLPRSLPPSLSLSLSLSLSGFDGTRCCVARQD